MRGRLIGVLCAVSLGTAGASARGMPPGLEARARAEGSVRAIVVLDLPTAPESDLRPDAARAQRSRIASMQEALLSEIAGTGHRPTFALRRLPILGVEATPATLSALARSPRVASVQEDGLNRPLLASSVPLVGADLTAAAGVDGRGWAVAVLDSGVDATHPFFQGRVVEEACFSAGGDCPDGSTAQSGPGAGAPCTFASGCSHGTHVAGIVAGLDADLAGVAPAAQIIALQVLSRFTGSACEGTDDPCAIAFDSDIFRAGEHVLDLAATHDVAAVNLSLGGEAYGSQALCDARNPGYKLLIDELRAAGIATVVASGNDGYADRIHKPACISTAVSVGSTSSSGQVSLFSNTALFLSLLAPGSGIVSSTAGGGFASRYGTSMAAPHVAGAWAMMRQTSPAASVSSVLDALRRSGTLVLDRAGVPIPRLNVFNAIGGLSVELPIPGSRLLIRNRLPDQPTRNRISFKSQGGRLPIAPAGSDGDPRCGRGDGARLTIWSDASGEILSQILPCEGWSLLGTEGKSKGWRYRDPGGDHGPCTKVRIHRGGKIGVVCKGSSATAGTYDLRIGETQSPVSIRLTTGASITYCAEVGGELRSDGTDGRSFHAREAPAPPSCSAPPGV